MKDYAEDIFGDTPQQEQMRGDQVENRSGGYVWNTDNWKQLRRFLILGTEGGTFYASGQDLTKENYQTLRECTKEDATKVVDQIVKISNNGEAVKNGPAIFSLVYVLKNADEAEERRYAADHFNEVIRTGTHLYQAADYVQHWGGWGRLTRKAFSNWYHEHDSLAYHLVKYRQRNGWTHRDVMRMAHPKPQDEQEDRLFEYAVKGWDEVPEEPSEEFMEQIWAFEKAKYLPTNQEGVQEIVRLIEEYDLPRECIPNEFLSEEEVWDALLQGGEYDMPVWAMLRNLGKMTSVGLLDGMSEATQKVTENLRDEQRIKRSRIHPLKVLQTKSVYESGGGVRGSLDWSPVTPILGALEDAFELSFENVEPTNRRILLAFDVSSSMTWGNVAGLSLTPREISAAIGYITAKTEDRYQTMAFSDNLEEFPVTGRDSISGIINRMNNMPFGSTNCSLPMRYARENGLDVDAFVIYTDNETNTGRNHPSEELQHYRDEYVSDAKLITVGMTANDFTIADPQDPNQMDVVGCSSTTPRMINRFIRDEI